MGETPGVIEVRLSATELQHFQILVGFACAVEEAVGELDDSGETIYVVIDRVCELLRQLRTDLLAIGGADHD